MESGESAESGGVFQKYNFGCYLQYLGALTPSQRHSNLSLAKAWPKAAQWQLNGRQTDQIGAPRQPTVAQRTAKEGPSAPQRN